MKIVSIAPAVSRQALALLALSLPLAGHAAVAQGAAAEILSLQGQGQQRASDQADWLAAATSQTLAPGAFVRTLPASKMALLFADETQVRLNQNSVLQVKQMVKGGANTLVLSLGRAWSQTKRAPDSTLRLETPAATAAIRGTDWELQVDADGKTELLVLSGTVEFSNALGSVSVAGNEAAVAEVGKAPVKILLSQPRDRIQWVNALRAEPLRHLAPDAVPATLRPLRAALASGDLAAARALRPALQDAPEWLALFDAVDAILSGERDRARARLALANQPGSASALPAVLIASDLALIDGDIDLAVAILETALASAPPPASVPALLAQLARVQLLADRGADSALTLARAGASDHPALALARAELARRQGQAAAATAAYSAARDAAPDDARTWFGLGSVLNERDLIKPARASLERALQLDPHGPGYRGELGTLDTYSNRFSQAEAAFAAALADNPADYVALTGLGLLRLKQGRPDAALDAFLRAGVMEPRYARAKTYTGVAYYQLGRRGDAIDTLRQASLLDTKDPLPYLFLSQIHTDLFQPGEASDAARAAVLRLPFLKSLNQLANDQKGSANFGAALAFFGMEDWANELAQQSATPYWAGSHLFLADRYPGEFNTNSELFQGYLTDPLAFGGSNRYASLLQRPGSYGSAGLTADRNFARMLVPSLTLNGLANATLPFAWFAQAQRADGKDMPIDVGVTTMPKLFDASGRADVHATTFTVGLGVQATPALGLFAYVNDFKVALRGHNALTLGTDTIHTDVDYKNWQGALGLSYRWGPLAQTWLKLGRSQNRTALAGYPVLFMEQSVIGVLTMDGVLDKQFNDLQWRHSVDIGEQLRLSAGVEQVREKQRNGVAGVGLVSSQLEDGSQFEDVLLFGGANDIARRFTAATLAGEYRPVAGLLFDASLTWNRLGERTSGENQVALYLRDILVPDSARVDQVVRPLALRIGVAYQPSQALSLRAAYLDWVRPLSVSTLNGIATAGIPIEDRLVEAGGRSKRSVLQLGWNAGERSFLLARAERNRIDNRDSPGVDLRTPSLPFLEDLKNAQSVNLSNVDVLEELPDFLRGRVSSLTLSGSTLLGARLSAYASYTVQATDAAYADSSAPTGLVGGKRIAFMPRHSALFGVTWARGQRSYLSARAIYRGERFEDESNLTRWPAALSADLVAFSETLDKHWVIGAGALNIGGRKSPRQKPRYVLDLRYRF